MASSRKAYFRRTRKVRMRELNHSFAGWAGMCAAVLAAVLFIGSVVISFLEEGNAGYYVGGLAAAAFVLALGAVLLGVLSKREQKIRPVPTRVGLVLGLMMIVVLGALCLLGAK